MNFVNQAQIPKTSIIKKPLKLNQIKPISRIQQIHKSNCSELRNQIKNNQSECHNIILFGPAGSGKSSLIQTFNQSLNQGKRKLENLCIQDLLHNEGTRQYQYFTIQDKQETVIKTNNKILKLLKTQINIIDTRGQILLNQKESKQIEVMLEGKVKDQIIVQQRDHRYAHMLWEFWKQDTELFPLEIFNTQPNQPNQVIFVFDGSLDQIPNGVEEIEFYREIIKLVRSRGYQNPFIVLTSLDKLEKKLSQMPHEKSIQIIDNRIQSIVKNLNIPREHVFFLENYHGQIQDDQIDYYSLKLLLECLRSQKQNIDNECNIF